MPKSRSGNDSPLDAAMRVLAHRSHGRAELIFKLRRKGFSADDSEAAVDRAIELGLSEPDEAVAARYATELARKPGATPRWVRAKLAERRFPSDAVDRGVRDAFENWDAQQAALAYAGPDQNLARVARRLERKGFSADVIGWTVRQIQTDLEES